MVHHTLLISLVFRLVLADNRQATGLNCSQIASVEKQSCGQVNSTVCGELGCCWNENEADSKLRCFNKSVSQHVGNTSTKCSAYQGQACRHSFLSTLSTFNTSARFHKVQQNASEAFLELSITFIAANVSHPECSSALVAMLCHDVMPPCSTLNNSAVRPWQLCANECSQIYAQCEPFVSQVSSAVNLIAQERGLNLSFPVCSGLKNASELDEASNGKCLKLGLNFTSSPEPTEKPVIPPVFPRAYDCSNRIPPEEKEACPIQNNQTMCAVIGCCWNATEEPTACFTKRGGTCMLYDGDICRTSFNSTLLTYKNSRRFFDNKFGLYFTEFFLRIAMGVIMDDDYVNDEKCRHILSNMLCHYTLPPCYPDNSIIDYCREDCLAIFQDCSAPLNRVIGAIKFLVKDKNIDFVHTALPNCSRHQTSQYYRDLPGNKTCIHTGFFRFTEDQMAKTTPNPPEDDNKLEIILPIVLIGLVVIVVCVAVFMFRRRSQRKKDAVDNGSALTHKGSMTMRDRLRAESLKSIDSRLMRLYDPNKLKQYRLDHVAYVKDLGEGFFGKVFQGRAAGLVDGQPKKVIPVAVKALKTDPSKEQKEEFFREVTLMSILQHPNVVELLAVSTEEEPYGMVFEFMSGGDLNQYLRGAKPAETSLNSNEKAKVYLSQEDLVSMATQIATGMQFLTELKFVHRDLAARNVLVGEGLVVKIADFGMSRDIYSSDYYKMSKETMLPIRWLAPEAFLYGKFSLKSDVYAYGVVLWEIFTFGLQPYYGYTNKEVTDFIKKGIHLGKPDNCPDFMYAIMKDCWHKEPEKRLNFSVIGSRLNDPYNNYDVPPSSDTEEGIDAIDSAEPDSGNYDVPRSPATSDYDIPRSAALESTYDVPRSSEDLRMSYAEDEDNTTREKNGQVYV